MFAVSYFLSFQPVSLIIPQYCIMFQLTAEYIYGYGAAPQTVVNAADPVKTDVTSVGSYGTGKLFPPVWHRFCFSSLSLHREWINTTCIPIRLLMCGTTDGDTLGIQNGSAGMNGYVIPRSHNQERAKVFSTLYTTGSIKISSHGGLKIQYLCRSEEISHRSTVK